MLTWNKLKKTLFAAGLILSFSAAPASAGCMPINPICLFKMILKATPGMPVFDFASVPAIIPHIPAALLKEGQVKMKEIADNALEKIRSGELPSMADIKLNVPGFEAVTPSSGQEYASLEGFPQMNSEDPLDVSKSIEVLFLRPGWQQGEDVTFTSYDKNLMQYYQGQFKYNNLIEISGYLAFMQGKFDQLMVMAEEVQKQIESADDLNKAQRANYAAHLMEYQLMIIYNQLQAASLQMDSASQLAGSGLVLDEPVLGNM